MANENSPATVWFTAARTERFVNSSAPRISQGGRRGQARRMDFAGVNRAALARLAELLGRWLPGGRVEGNEYVALNPRRADRRPGSFKVNLRTGKWADFAVGAKGGDAISLAAYLAGCGQAEAARRLAAMLGIAADA